LFPVCRFDTAAESSFNQPVFLPERSIDSKLALNWVAINNNTLSSGRRHTRPNKDALPTTLCLESASMGSLVAIDPIRKMPQSYTCTGVSVGGYIGSSKARPLTGVGSRRQCSDDRALDHRWSMVCLEAAWYSEVQTG